MACVSCPYISQGIFRNICFHISNLALLWCRSLSFEGADSVGGCSLRQTGAPVEHGLAHTAQNPKPGFLMSDFNHINVTFILATAREFQAASLEI